MSKALIKKVSTPVKGKIDPPTSKSLSNRALLIASLAEGETRITGLLESDDTKYMKECLRGMGVKFRLDEFSIVVTGVPDIKPVSAEFFVGNAGTVARFFSAAAALSRTEITIDGDPAMRKRPIEPLLKSLTKIGLSAGSDTGFFPITVGGDWTQSENTVTVDADNSSQYISALLIVAPFLPEGLTIQTKSPEVQDGFGYIDLTIQIMRHFGINVQTIVDGHKWKVNNGMYKGTDYVVEADASAMTYIWAAEALTEGCVETGFSSESSNQPDSNSHHIIRDYKNMPSTLECSMMQDSVPTIAVMSALSNRFVRLTGLKNLRVKECDRVQAIHDELSKFGNDIVRIEGNDLCINGRNSIMTDAYEVDIETYDDHRIAMAFSLVGLVRDGVSIQNPECASKTYPKYWEDFSEIGVSITLQ